MIYTIVMIATLIFLAYIFRDDLKTDTSEYLAMVCLGAMVWPIGILYGVYIWYEWRKI